MTGSTLPPVNHLRTVLVLTLILAAILVACWFKLKSLMWQRYPHLSELSTEHLTTGYGNVTLHPVMAHDLREEGPGLFLPDPLARTVPAGEVQLRTLLEALVGARRSGDRELANRLLGELVQIKEDEREEMLRDGQ